MPEVIFALAKTFTKLWACYVPTDYEFFDYKLLTNQLQEP